jgi:hypothetical protein
MNPTILAQKPTTNSVCCHNATIPSVTAKTPILPLLQPTTTIVNNQFLYGFVPRNSVIQRQACGASTLTKPLFTIPFSKPKELKKLFLSPSKKLL